MRPKERRSRSCGLDRKLTWNDVEVIIRRHKSRQIPCLPIKWRAGTFSLQPFKVPFYLYISNFLLLSSFHAHKQEQTRTTLHRIFPGPRTHPVYLISATRPVDALATVSERLAEQGSYITAIPCAGVLPFEAHTMPMKRMMAGRRATPNTMRQPPLVFTLPRLTRYPNSMPRPMNISFMLHDTQHLPQNKAACCLVQKALTLCKRNEDGLIADFKHATLDCIKSTWHCA